MKILFFGIYDADAPVNARTRILLRGLKEKGIVFEECRADSRSLSRFWILFKKYIKIKKDFDIIFLAYTGGQLVFPLAKILAFFSGKKIVIDPVISLYDTMARDRKLIGRVSFKAAYYYALDALAFKFSDLVIFDTEDNIKYFSRFFKIPRSKSRRLFIGTDEKTMRPLNFKKQEEKFVVHFHGFFIPLQGIEYIIYAAKLLEKENVFFNIIGKGQEYGKTIKLAEELNLNNVNFFGAVPYKDLPDYMSEADIVLGIFGTTAKAARVVPNKAYDAIASQKPLVSAGTSAMKEIFTDRENILFTKQGDARDMAEKILELKNNPELRKKIADNGFKLFKEKLSGDIIVNEFIKILEEVLT